MGSNGLKDETPHLTQGQLRVVFFCWASGGGLSFLALFFLGFEHVQTDQKTTPNGQQQFAAGRFGDDLEKVFQQVHGRAGASDELAQFVDGVFAVHEGNTTVAVAMLVLLGAHCNESRGSVVVGAAIVSPVGQVTDDSERERHFKGCLLYYVVFPVQRLVPC